MLARANAITNQVYYLSVNAAGPARDGGRASTSARRARCWPSSTHAEPEVTHLEIDLDRVTEVRTHGTAGLNRVWEQLRADDDPIDLPVYDGRMAHGRWQPGRLDPRNADD